jgi:hypothetical protein
MSEVRVSCSLAFTDTERGYCFIFQLSVRGDVGFRAFIVVTIFQAFRFNYFDTNLTRIKIIK